MIAKQGPHLAPAAPESVAIPSEPSTASGGRALDVLPSDQFEALIRMGRARGGLTQDDVMTVLRSVELNADLISDVVERIREAGIEFTYDTGETTIVPMTGAVADDLSERLRHEFPVLPDHAGIPAVGDGIPPALIVALEPPWSPTTRRSGSAIGDEGPA